MNLTVDVRSQKQIQTPCAQVRRLSASLSERHKGWALGIPQYIEIPKNVELPTIIAVGGGKGGVGKSILSANLAVKLAAQRFRVLAVDLDLGGAESSHAFWRSSTSKYAGRFFITTSKKLC